MIFGSVQIEVDWNACIAFHLLSALDLWIETPVLHRIYRSPVELTETAGFLHRDCLRCAIQAHQNHQYHRTRMMLPHSLRRILGIRSAAIAEIGTRSDIRWRCRWGWRRWWCCSDRIRRSLLNRWWRSRRRRGRWRLDLLNDLRRRLLWRLRWRRRRWWWWRRRLDEVDLDDVFLLGVLLARRSHRRYQQQERKRMQPDGNCQCPGALPAKRLAPDFFVT
jgi:hypothetical protein